MLSNERKLPPPVLTKVDFVRRYEAGEFGNRSPTWVRFNQYWHSGYNGLIHFRNRVAGGRTWYNLSRKDAFELIFKLKEEEAPEYGNLYFSAMCPTEDTTIQGEVVEDVTGRLRLYYSDVKKPMRQSLAEGGRNVGHIEAITLLRRYMNERSYSWFNWLLEAYPNHVIEFTCLSRNWGTDAGFNTLFWEVRDGY